MNYPEEFAKIRGAIRSLEYNSLQVNTQRDLTLDELRDFKAGVRALKRKLNVLEVIHNGIIQESITF